MNYEILSREINYFNDSFIKYLIFFYNNRK